jgi:chromosome segregation ATPase
MNNEEDDEGGYIDTRDSEIDELKEELTSWKAKYKALELKKRESDLALNKIKTEINSLRSVDKNWRDAAKVVYLNLSDLKTQFFSQVDQVIDGLNVVCKVGERIEEKQPYIKAVRITISQLQQKVRDQEGVIAKCRSEISHLTAELEDKSKKVERLSQGIEEEVERLCKPMRDRLADAMVQIMKEKSARAQERRQLADLWPEDRLMPTLLMKYRALTDAEREKRKVISFQQNADIALSLEIRHNVGESKCWELKYDDYGRTFYEHKKTG